MIRIVCILIYFHFDLYTSNATLLAIERIRVPLILYSSVWPSIATMSRVSVAFSGSRSDRQRGLPHGQLHFGASNGTSSRYRELSLLLHSAIHHQ